MAQNNKDNANNDDDENDANDETLDQNIHKLYWNRSRRIVFEKRLLLLNIYYVNCEATYMGIRIKWQKKESNLNKDGTATMGMTTMNWNTLHKKDIRTPLYLISNFTYWRQAPPKQEKNESNRIWNNNIRAAGAKWQRLNPFSIQKRKWKHLTHTHTHTHANMYSQENPNSDFSFWFVNCSFLLSFFQAKYEKKVSSFIQPSMPP